MHTTHIIDMKNGDYKVEGTISKAPTTNVKIIGYINTKNQNFTWHHLDMHITQAIASETGTTKVKGP